MFIGGTERSLEAFFHGVNTILVLAHFCPHPPVQGYCRRAKEGLGRSIYKDTVFDGGLAAKVVDRADFKLRRMSFLDDGRNSIDDDRFRQINNPLAR